jgi:hypothetical protein
MKKVTEEELTTLQEMQATFTKMKITLGDLEIKKQSLLKEVEGLREAFMTNEKMLIVKYGENAIINIQTGEITEKI